MGKEDKLKVKLAVAMKNLESEKKARSSAEIKNAELEEALKTKTEEKSKLNKELKDERIRRNTVVEELKTQTKEHEETKKMNEELRETKSKYAKAYKNLQAKIEEEKQWAASEKVKEQLKTMERDNKDLNDQVAGLRARNRSLGSDNGEDGLEGALTNWTEISHHMEGIMAEDFTRFQIFWAKEVGPQKVSNEIKHRGNTLTRINI